MDMNQKMRTEHERRSSRWLATFATILATVTQVGCQASLTGLGPGSVLIGGIRYGVTSLTIAESFPVQIDVTVEIVNESTTSQSVTFPDGCVVLMRAYGEGADPVWDMGDTVACTLALVEVQLAPGESEVFQTGLVSAATILGDALPNGEYRITVYLRPGQVLELEAGRTDLSLP